MKDGNNSVQIDHILFREFVDKSRIYDDISVLSRKSLIKREKCDLCKDSYLIYRDMLISDRKTSVDGKQCPKCGKLFIEVSRADIMLTEMDAVKTHQLSHIRNRGYYKYKGTVDFDDNTTIQKKNDVNVEKKQQVKASEKKKEDRKLIHNTVYEIGLNSFVFKTNHFRCLEENHHIENITANIYIRSTVTGIYKLYSIPAGYCQICDRYYIDDKTFEAIEKTGIPLCRLVDFEEYDRLTQLGKYDLREQSILMEYGYNVNAKSKLPAKMRQDILAMLMDYKICSRHRILSILDFLIDNGNRKKTAMSDAVSKWNEDKQFVETYKIRHQDNYIKKAALGASTKK